MAKEVENSPSWIAEARQYVLDVRGEFRKVTWPPRREAMGGTIGVVVIVAIITVVLGSADAILAEIVRRVLP
jgi:preprotein translocase subunit SecE